MGENIKLAALFQEQYICLVEEFERKLKRDLSEKERDFIEWLAMEKVKEIEREGNNP